MEFDADGAPAAVEDIEPAWSAGLRRLSLRVDGEPVEVALWYPAANTAACAPLEYGGPPPLFRLPALAADAPPAAVVAPPLVLLAGDRGCGALDLGWLGVHLARRGCLVAAAAPPAGDGASFVAASCERLHEVADFVPVALAGAFARADRGHAVVGFALGGIAAMALAGVTVDGIPALGAPPLQDSRLRAVALLNPAPKSAIRGGLGVVSVPLHVLVSAADRVAPPAANGERIAAAVRGARLTRLAPPAGHNVFHSEATRAGYGLAADRATDHAAVHRGSVHERCAALIAVLVHAAMPAVGDSP